jgi:S1-C subfamily serine protease
VSRRGRGLIAATVVTALVITAVVAFRWGSTGPDRPATARPTSSPEASAPPSIAEIYATLSPSVVSIRATGGGAGARAAVGTGVIANADGAILTALHVVADAESIEVAFADGTRSAATVGAADPANDIAALVPANLPAVLVPAVLGGGVSVGDEVVAIGNQLGLTQSTTAGVVSGLGRSFAREDAEDAEDAEDIEGLIQFDAAVNPGSSGGPLINANGETVGIVIALANPTDADTFIGIGFAVPIGTALGAGAGDGRPPQL